MRSCKAESDSLKRLTCFDAIALPESAVALAAPTLPAGAPSKASVELVSAKMRIQSKNYERQIFHDRVELLPTFKNASTKTVVAIAHTITVTDAFGDKIIDGESKLDIKIPPGKTVESNTYYLWEDNEFIQGEPYDRLTGPVSTGTAKATLKVRKVIYSDGTSETF
ncbi:hypothetical protein AMJ96_CH02649 [Rhizobium sp. N113]|nr:hypothetical protein AMJ96_CH02649 [Rhizobium sp. N113]